MTTMDGLAAALAIGAILVVPLGLWCVSAPHDAVVKRLLGAARVGAFPAGILATVAVLLPVGPLAVCLVLPWLTIGAAAVATAVAQELAEWRRFRPDVRHVESAGLVFWASHPCS